MGGNESTSLIPSERIERRILLLRGQHVMLAADLAELYDVPTKALNQAVRRNLRRFPADFMFQLTWEEARALSRSQFVTLKRGQNPKYRPYAFTEHGVAMLASVLRSDRAVDVNIAIVRAFVALRRFLSSQVELARRLQDLERKVGAQGLQIRKVYDLIRQLMAPPSDVDGSHNPQESGGRLLLTAHRRRARSVWFLSRRFIGGSVSRRRLRRLVPPPPRALPPGRRAPPDETTGNEKGRGPVMLASSRASPSQ